MNIRYRVDLSEAERGELRAMLSGGKHAARRVGEVRAGCEGLVQLMRHCAGDGAHRGETGGVQQLVLHLAHPRFRPTAVGDVARHADDAHHLALVVAPG